MGAGRTAPTLYLGMLKKLEIVQLSDGWNVELATPNCGLKLSCRGRSATHGVRVHACMFAFACGDCVKQYTGRIRAVFEGSDVLQCSGCWRFYTRKGYCSIIKLNKSEKKS